MDSPVPNATLVSGYSSLSVNSDLSCTFCFINKISTVMQKKKKKKIVEYMGQGVCADYVFSVCCWIRVGIRSPFKFVRVLLDLCGDLNPLQVCKCQWVLEMFSLNPVRPCSSSLHQSTRFQIKGFEFGFFKVHVCLT